MGISDARSLNSPGKKINRKYELLSAALKQSVRQ